jgi:ABC-type transport system involved in multi-copper enzyme maturation permease subunit
LLIGPAFAREAWAAPRRPRHYIARTAYVVALLVLMWTLWMVLAGTQEVRNISDLARFGMILFQLLAPLQLAVVVFFSALSTASAVAHEKDRRTLVLLLMTRLNNCELVLGKLLGSLLHVFTLFLAGLPVFAMVLVFGGVSPEQAFSAMAVTLAAALAAGSLGSTIALWRERTFQTLAMTALVLAGWIGAWEAVRSGAFGSQWLGISTETWAVWFSPWRAVLEASRPHARIAEGSVATFLAVSVGLTVLLNAVAVWRVRTWNSVSEGARRVVAEETPETAAHKPEPKRAPKLRRVWNMPVIWREISTWAYGRKVVLVRLVYALGFALALSALWYQHEMGRGITLGGAALVLVPLIVLSLTLINAQAVTAVTAERDLGALDLLLVTDITPKEFVFGKVGGVLYNTKEMVLLPLVPCFYLWQVRAIGTEDLWFLIGGLVVMQIFVVVLGLHVGMSYINSRTAIAISLGTVFFLTLGIATCMRIMVAFGGSFQVQLAPFFAFVLGGGIGLFVALGIRNPSTAILISSLICPFATFYAITSFLLHNTLAVFIVVSLTYGFTTVAMLVPAISEFDVATGRTTGGEGGGE